VYLDAVFHPRCLEDPKVFQQEGWHFELDEKDSDMVLKGVVFNEMKGVYSQPDSVHYQEVQSQLFPDNNYASNSGGDPEVIPDLTFEKFKDFHARYYHPSNARCAFCLAALNPFSPYLAFVHRGHNIFASAFFSPVATSWIKQQGMRVPTRVQTSFWDSEVSVLVCSIAMQNPISL
jgi:hypothetical protein